MIIGCEQTREALVVDPGDEVGRILEVLDRHKLRVAGILQTHAHFDHVGATKPLKVATGAPVYLHKEDLFLYRHLAEQVVMFGLKAPEPVEIEYWFKEGDVVKAGTCTAQVLHTPGHSPGSVCFSLPGKLLSGDTLFAGSIGRTDLWGGSYEQIIQSIRTKLLTLPDDTEVHPGHGPSTTVGQEKRYNPFLQEYF
jgi:glyoxylase-like metal-dependent hydrolase (beta-lactamase superfamily II)